MSFVARYTPVYVVADVFNICTIEELAEKYGGGLWRPLSEGHRSPRMEAKVADLESVTDLERAGCSPLANHIGGLCTLRAEGAGERLNSYA